MPIPQTEIELLQATTDVRFGGDRELLAKALEKIEREFDRPGEPLFRKVGNNCLVFYTNTEAMRVCEANPDSIQGTIISDFDCAIQPGAVVIGSVLSGTARYPAMIDSASQVLYSNVSMARVQRSIIDGSYASVGDIWASELTASYTIGHICHSFLTRSVALIGRMTDVEASDRILGYYPKNDRDDLDNLAARMLASSHLRRAA